MITPLRQPMSPIVKYVPVHGGTVYCKTVHKSGNGKPLVVLHGGPGCPHDYLETLDACANERPVIFYDQLGCGRSDRPSDVGLWNLDRFIDELALVAKALNLESFHLFGHSWGTMLAVDYTLAYPTQVDRLVLTSPCLSMVKVRADMERLKATLPLKVVEIIAREEAAGSTDSPAYRYAMMEFYRRHVCRLQPWPAALHRSYDGWSWQVYKEMWGPSEFYPIGNLREYEREGLLSNIANETLFLCGRFDEMTPEATLQYAQRIRNAKAKVFERSAHLSPLEEPDDFVSTMRAFLNIDAPLNS